MTPLSDESIGLTVLACVTIIPAVWVYIRHRDLFDPRVVFPLVYGYGVAGPCINYLLSDWYLLGIKTEYILQVLFSCSSAAFCFSVGVTLALHRIGSATIQVQPFAPGTEEADANLWTMRLTYLLALTSVAMLAYCTFEVVGSVSGVSKALYREYADPTIFMLYRKFHALSKVLIVAFIAANAFTGKSKLPLVALLWFYSIVCLAAGERDFILLCFFWIAISRRQLSRSVFIAVILLCALSFVLCPLARRGGLQFGTQLETLRAKENVVEEARGDLLGFCGNILVFTNVVSMIPDQEPFYHGETLVISLSSFIPGDFEYKNRSPMLWFMENFDCQGTAGHAFAIDAEGYMNFGWAGPPLFFFVLGSFLGILYRRAAITRGWFNHIYYYWALMACLFAIRADSRDLLKTLVYGAVFFACFSMLGHMWASRGTTLDLSRRSWLA